jgi:hypothetical protein
LDNYVGYKGKTILTSLQIGKLPGQQKYFGGIGCKTNELYQYKKYMMDLTANLSYQPKLWLEDPNMSESSLVGILSVHHRLQVNNYLALHGSLSYKTAGFLEGIVTQGGFLWQAGFSFSLPATQLLPSS